MPAPPHIPETIKQFWRDNPTEYSKDDIYHLDPDSENAVFLKYLLENGFATIVFKLNGKPIGEYNGGEAFNLDIILGNLTIQKNGENLGTYNGSSSKTVNVEVPVITYGTAPPSGGKPGDVYMRYLA